MLSFPEGYNGAPANIGLLIGGLLYSRIAGQEMKMRTLCIVIAAALLAILTTLEAKPTPTPRPKQTPQPPKARVGNIANPEAETPPFVGMTKAQALARYGKPKRHTITEEGEQWVYLLNMGEVIGKAFIPFNFKPTIVRTGVLIFGAGDTVKKFTWDSDKHD